VRLAVSTLVLGLLVGWSAEAAAYCRVTTCDVKKGMKCALNDNGCVREGAALRWPTLPIAYRFHAKDSEKLDGREARIAIRAAFQRWTDVICANGQRTSLRFEEKEDTPYDKPLEVNAHAPEGFAIFFRDEAWPYEGGENTLAITNHDYGVKSGLINYADIEINTSAGPFATRDGEKGIDLQAVLLHEVGHYIGLAHNNDPTSIMVATHCQSAERCQNAKSARSLSDDDQLAVCTLYPPEGTTTVPDSMLTSNCSATPGDSPGSNVALGGIVFALGLVVTRRRQARASR
jgi:MYXO-CTERM domain-containing protein